MALYVYTAAPGLTFVDSGELAVACRTLGIAHPPGFPLYVLLGHAFSYLPLVRDVAGRLALYSALCAALSAGMTFLLCRQLISLAQSDQAPPLGISPLSVATGKNQTDNKHPRSGSKPAGSKAQGRKPKNEARSSLVPALSPEWAAVAAALVFGFSLSLWTWAVVIEVYALNILLVALGLWLAARGDWGKAALTAGLALGVHHVTVALALPAACYLLWTWHRPTRRDWLAIVALCAAGMLVYLYLPLRAAQSPTFAWGDPRSPASWWWHVTAKQYRGAGVLRTSLGSVTYAVGYCLGLWLRQFTPAGFLMGAWGLVALFRRHRRLFWFIVLVIVPNTGFTLAYDIRDDIEGYYLPTFLAWACCFAFGAEALSSARLFRASGLRRKALAGGLLAVALLPAVVNFAGNNRRHDRVAPLFVENTLRGTVPGALILTSDWEVFSPWLYRRYVEGFRPDSAVITTRLLRCSWYLDFIERQYPELARAAATEFAACRKLIGKDGPCNSSYAKDGIFIALAEALVRARINAGRPVYYTWTIESGLSNSPFLANVSAEPQGLLYKLVARSSGTGAPAITPLGQDVELDLTGLADGTVPTDFVKRDVRRAYAAMLAVRAKYLLGNGDVDAARARAELALRLEPDLPQGRDVLSLLPQR